MIKHKAKPLKFVLPICFLSVEHKKRQSRFFTRPTPLVAQWLISHQNELHTPGIPFLTLLSFFTLPSQTVQTVDVRSIGVQFSIAMGLLCARDTPLNMSKTHFFFYCTRKFWGTTICHRQLIFRRQLAPTKKVNFGPGWNQLLEVSHFVVV